MRVTTGCIQTRHRPRLRQSKCQWTMTLTAHGHLRLAVQLRLQLQQQQATHKKPLPQVYQRVPTGGKARRLPQPPRMVSGVASMLHGRPPRQCDAPLKQMSGIDLSVSPLARPRVAHAPRLVVPSRSPRRRMAAQMLWKMAVHPPCVFSHHWKRWQARPPERLLEAPYSIRRRLIRRSNLSRSSRRHHSLLLGPHPHQRQRRRRPQPVMFHAEWSSWRTRRTRCLRGLRLR